MSQDRITITRDYNWRRLEREVAERGDGPFLVVGIGARARRLCDRVLQEVPDAVIVPGQNPREHAILIHPGDGPLLSREPGGPPTLARLGTTWRLG